MRRIHVLPLLTLALSALGLQAQSAPRMGVNLAFMDRQADPCKDLYRFSNGAFDASPIPAAYAAYGVNQEIDERNEALLKEILESAAKATDAPAGSVTARLRDFYLSGMDTAAIEAQGLKPLKPFFDAIDAMQKPGDLAPVMARLRTVGIGAGFGFGIGQDDKDSSAMTAQIWQGGLGLPEREFYFRTDAQSLKILAAYEQHMARMFELSGTKPGVAKVQAKRVMALEVALAKVSRKLEDLRDPESNYHKLTRPEIAKEAPAFPWEGYFEGLGLPATEKTLVIGQPEFLKGFAQLTHRLPMADWKAYLRWRVLNTASSRLSEALERESFAFYGQTLRGRKEMFPRWKRVMSMIDGSIGEDLGQAYVKRAFSPEAKARVLEMIRFHKEALKQSILRAPWMGEATKVKALEKLEAMRAKVGYPDAWRDYRTAGIKAQPYVLNTFAAEAFEFRRRIAKLGRPVDRDEWDMTPQTNNAYYSPNLNEIVLPAGILQAPFFSMEADDASNYGALASTIGHEMLHGFDDQGCQYDAQGNLKNWWTEADRKAYEALTGKVVAEFNAFEVQPGLFVNGKQTLGENLADIGGLKISFEAWKLAAKGQTLATADGLSPEQRFFVAFAQGWRTNMRPEAERTQVQSDVHSPVRCRVNGPAIALPEVRQAFGCAASETVSPIW